MPTITTVYQGDLRTKAKHLKSGNELITDAPTDNQGKGEAFSPTDLLCSSLGSCMLTIMGIKAEKEGFDIKGTEIETTKIMQDSPRKVSEVIIEFKMPNNKYTNDQKKLLHNAAITCPVALSLNPDIKQSVRFDYK